MWSCLLFKSSGIVFFTALCIITGNMCRQTFRNVQLAEMGPGAAASNDFSGVLDPAPHNIVAEGADMPFAKRDSCICIGRTLGHPIRA